MRNAVADDRIRELLRRFALHAVLCRIVDQRAFGRLESEGLLCVKGTLGRFVTEDIAVLEAAKQQAARELVAAFKKKADALSITADELISMLKEAEK